MLLVNYVNIWLRHGVHISALERYISMSLSSVQYLYIACKFECFHTQYAIASANMPLRNFLITFWASQTSSEYNYSFVTRRCQQWHYVFRLVNALNSFNNSDGIFAGPY